MPDSNVLGAAAALGSAAAWAVGPFLFKTISEGLSPLALTLSKGVCSVVLLGAACLLASQSPLDTRSLAVLAGSGLLGIALGDTCFFQALRDLSAFSLIMLLMVGQALTVLLAMVFLDEALTSGRMVGILLVMVGVLTVLFATSGDEGSTPTRARGVVFGLLAAICTAVSWVMTKAVLHEGSDTMQATLVRMLAGTLGVFGFGLVTGSVSGWLTPFRDVRLLARFAAAVAVIAFGGFWLGMVAYKHTSVVVASTLTATEPVIALGITVVILRQRVSLLAVAGTAMTFAGVVMLVPQMAEYLRENAGALF